MKLGVKRTSAAILALLIGTESALSGACSVTATNLNFGTYNTANGSPTNGAGNVNVECSFLLALLLSYTVKLSTGSSGTYTARQMENTTYDLNYNLYTNLARTSVWGDGSGGTGYNSFSSLVLLLYHNANYTVYGRIPATQNIPAGGYTDTITVTVTY